MENMLARLNAPTPEAWRPKPGDTLVGKVVELDIRTGVEYADYPIIVVQTDDGRDLAWHCFHAVAKAELARRRPAVGDTVGVKYLGKPAGKSYENYKIVVEHAHSQDTGPDWSKIGMQAAADGADETADGWWPAEDVGSAFTEPTDGAAPF